MSEDESMSTLVELRDQVLRTYQSAQDLLKRGGDALTVQVALTNDWSRMKRPSDSQAVDYREEIARIKSLSGEYSVWMKEHPATGSEFFKNASEKYRHSSMEEKIEFMKQFLDDRISHLDHQLPELKSIVDALEASVLRLKEIVFREFR
jgi:hypothetical protein